jgi:hypothetical protein
MYAELCAEHVAHHYEPHLPATIGLDPMEAKKLCDESVLIYLYMMVITLQHIQQHLASKGNSKRIPKSDRANVLTSFSSDFLVATNNMLCNKLTFVEEKNA